MMRAPQLTRIEDSDRDNNSLSLNFDRPLRK